MEYLNLANASRPRCHSALASLELWEERENNNKGYDLTVWKQIRCSRSCKR